MFYENIGVTYKYKKGVTYAAPYIIESTPEAPRRTRVIIDLQYEKVFFIALLFHFIVKIKTKTLKITLLALKIKFVFY